ncbi:carboxymuconolactone decarboxylase family protein [Duganella violaceipulchra]|uniref:AhpD family alkylhydroperoxidase n=1 Tax=Duganella violaceipulchra TaxID=2849652 RepID=A0AA41L6N3_9BURK|nr:carboxymuconolactone decarboxylase family protein [Duganella violaceicalia]MBV6325449.1 carboxymuconolactone decarboxylase family protein [Duganella violaceicalia]MCP2012650.1 AhpD family alkylhydroperoxidase [Duganella violaceicalia]
MLTRLNFCGASPETIKALSALEGAANNLGLEASQLELVKARASQLNGCAYWVDLHTTDARKAGEADHCLRGVSARRETPFFSRRKHAALGWTVALTRLPLAHAPDADYEYQVANFSSKETADLTLAISTINRRNRLAVGLRRMPAA